MPFSNSKVSVIEIVFKGKPNTYEIAAKDEALSFSFWLNLSSHLYLSDTVCEAIWAAAEGPAIELLSTADQFAITAFHL